MDNERKNKIEYHKEGDYYVPNLVAPKDEYPDYCIGKYGRLRLNYLKENKKAEYTIMLMEGTLRKHIVETDMQAKDKVERIIVDLHFILSNHSHFIFFNKNSLFQIFLSYFQIIFLIFAN